jgi:hypothetical protein
MTCPSGSHGGELLQHCVRWRGCSPGQGGAWPGRLAARRRLAAAAAGGTGLAQRQLGCSVVVEWPQQGTGGATTHGKQGARGGERALDERAHEMRPHGVAAGVRGGQTWPTMKLLVGENEDEMVNR